eukprot:TRINITY_DN11853_c0_g1_i4.p1 TRINITY_DN11853_c0_g1~~TRINITY_DN11853_c0_g1_i4.p1  ORF type:complete len:188 (+),score=30.11 TRINITY_DN11853_c0_g1_i4:174-737(+)
MKMLWQALPRRLRLREATKLMDTDSDGFSLSTLLDRASGCTFTILVLKDQADTVFGGFGTASWSKQSGFFGTGEAFVFSCDEEAPRGVHLFEWAQGENENRFFQSCTTEGLGFGGGEGGTAFWMDDCLHRGTSGASGTFGNPGSLCGVERFTLARVELYGFVTPEHSPSVSAKPKVRHHSRSASVNW